LFVTRIQYAIESETEAVALATQNIATTISGAAKSTNATFPFVTQPLFEINGYTARSESTLEIGVYTPTVVESQKDQWQSYAVNKIDWIDESRAFLKDKGIETDSATNEAHPVIWEIDSTGTRVPSIQGPYLPIWLVRILIPTKILIYFSISFLFSSPRQSKTTPPPAAPDLLINFDMLAASYTYDIFRAILVTRGTSY
jgi:hypothetical protein